MELIKDTIELIPRETAARRNVRTRALSWAVVGLAALVALLFSLVSLLVQAHRTEASVEQLREHVVQMRGARDRLLPLRQQLEQGLARQDLAQKLLVEPDWNDIISDLSAAINGQIWIQQLQMEQPLQPAEAQAPSTITVAGSAAGDMDLLQFMNRFAASPRLEGLVLQQSRHEDEENGEQAQRVDFVVQGTLRKQSKES